jgi:hypothetical protein
MKKKLWISNDFSGNWGLLEIGFWLLLFPLLMVGVVGWLIIAAMVVLVVIVNWGKYWYKCINCGYSTLLKHK